MFRFTFPCRSAGGAARLPARRRADGADGGRGVVAAARPHQRRAAVRTQRRRAPGPGVADQADDRVPRVRRAARQGSTPSQPVPVSERAWRAEGSRMFIEPRRAVSVDELLRGMIVQSGNDASIALAELVAGSEAGVRRADERGGEAARAREHALRQRDGAVAPAALLDRADLGALASALIRDFPEYYPLYSLKEYRYNNITQPNRNRLLWIDPYVDGVKTGHTDAAGWCLIASAKRGERRLVVGRAGRGVGRGARRREPEAPQLRLPGLRHRAALPVRQAGVDAARVEGRGERTSRPASSPTSTSRCPRARRRSSQLTMTASEPLRGAGRARAARRHRQGRARGQDRSPSFRWSRSPTCRLASIFGRAWDTVRLWFK